MIENLKDLEKFFKLCRKQGIVKADLVNQSFEFGDLPVEQRTNGSIELEDDPYKNFPQGELTPEQLTFYSSGGVPENDPTIKAS